MEIRVWGGRTRTEKLYFNGSYGDATGHHSIEGRTPAVYRLKAKGVVSASFQEASDLYVGVPFGATIVGPDGAVLTEQETRAAWGVVTLAAHIR